MSKPVTTLVMLEPPKLSESPMFLQRYVDFELDDNCSFLSDDQPCVVEENVKPSSFARKFSGWTDVITRTLIRQRPKRHIDNQDQSQFVSKEESEYRLLLLFLTFSLITCLATTGLLITCPFYFMNKDIITLSLRQQPSTFSFLNLLHDIKDNCFISGLKVPHILIIYQNGKMADYSTNETLSPSRNVSMKLTCSNSYKNIFGAPNRSCYTFAYADLQTIYIFYGNAKRDMTYIDCRSFHYGTIPGTKLNKGHIEGIATKVGDKFVMLGENDYIDELHSSSVFFAPLSPLKSMLTEVTTWSDRKQNFLGHHPDFIEATVDYTCATGFNRTHFLLVNKPFSNGEVSMVDIDRWTETAMPRIPLTNPNSRVTCEVEFGKESLRLTAISKIHSGLDESSRMYQYNFQTEEWIQSNTNLKYFGTLKIVNGIKYFFNILNTERHFGYYYNAKDATWIQLSIPGFFGEELSINWEKLENVIAVAYYA